ncbi:MAG: hypothetical protein ABL931_06680 [Usitatibacteraceae bacterium]
MDFEKFFEALRKAIPEFDNAVREHISFHEGVIAHFLMVEFSAFFCGLFEALESLEMRESLVRRTLFVMDSALKLNEEPINELIVLSFIDNLQISHRKRDEFDRIAKDFSVFAIEYDKNRERLR